MIIRDKSLLSHTNPLFGVRIALSTVGEPRTIFPITAKVLNT
jgi:hypothetical protein